MLVLLFHFLLRCKARDNAGYNGKHTCKCEAVLVLSGCRFDYKACRKENQCEEDCHLCGVAENSLLVSADFSLSAENSNSVYVILLDIRGEIGVICCVGNRSIRVGVFHNSDLSYLCTI